MEKPSHNTVPREHMSLRSYDTTDDAFRELVSEPAVAVMDGLMESILYHETQYKIKKLKWQTHSLVYTVSTANRHFVLEICTETFHKRKTENELATLQWVQSHTKLPVPKVIAHGSDKNHTGRYEWIMAETSSNNRLFDVWEQLSICVKMTLVQQVATLCAQAFNNRMWAIGSLYQDRSSPSGLNFGPNVSDYFITEAEGEEITNLCITFNSSRSWVLAQIQLKEKDLYFRLEKAEQERKTRADPENQVEDPTQLEAQLHLLSRLRCHLDQFFPRIDPWSEKFIMALPPLSPLDILVDSNGGLAGIVNWRGISTEPVTTACRIPTFLDEMSSENLYEKVLSPEDYTKLPSELTQLKEYFLREVEALAPGWSEANEQGQRKRSFLSSVANGENHGICPPGCRCIEALERRNQDGCVIGA